LILKRENKEKANWIYYLARNFGARFVILKIKKQGIRDSEEKVLSKYKNTLNRS